MSQDLVKIGQITSPHGVHGQVRVYPLTDFPDRFLRLRQVLLGPEARPVGVTYKARVKELVILELEGIDTREKAEALRQHYLQVDRSEIHPLQPGQYYLFDLIGLAVVDLQGQPLGRLVAVDQSSPVHDLYVVETGPGKRYMVPAVRAFVREISLEKGQVVIAPIPGLLEE